MKGREAPLPAFPISKIMLTSRKTSFAAIRPGMLGIPQIAGLGFRRGWVFSFGFFVP